MDYIELTDEKEQEIRNDIENCGGLNDRRGSYLLFEHTNKCLEDCYLMLDACSGDIDTLKAYQSSDTETRGIDRVVEKAKEILERIGEI